ncbi:MAG: hypothetical protein QXR35_01175 [Candidatus Korarchaeum sp.]
MRVKLGILISTFMTLMISLSLLYASINLLHKFTPSSYIGVAVSITLATLSAAAFLGKDIALQILSIFYFILALVGILLALSLPPEGLLISLPSLATATYLWRYGRGREGRPGEGPRDEAKDSTFSPDNTSDETIIS